MALYDPNQFPGTKTDFTLADVLAWARTKPADEAYDFLDFQNCAICQFLRETGRAAKPSVDPWEWNDDAVKPRKSHGLDARINDAAYYDPRTFGAFADRLEKALAT